MGKQYVQCRSIPRKKITTGLFFKNGRNMSTFHFDESRVTQRSTGVYLHEQECSSHNTMLKVQDQQGGESVHTSAVIWTPITKDGVIAGFRMSFPDRFPLFQAFFGIEVERKKVGSLKK